jgi:hypothetical protein
VEIASDLRSRALARPLGASVSRLWEPSLSTISRGLTAWGPRLVGLAPRINSTELPHHH